MAFFSIHDNDFWGRNLGPIGPIEEAGGRDGIMTSVFTLGNESENAPTALALRMEPGYVLPRHAHDCHRLEVVLQGSMQIDGGRILKRGDIMVSEPKTLYGPHIAGPEGCVTIEVFSDHKSSFTTWVETLSGELLECNLQTDEGAQQMVRHMKEQEAAREGN